jgi:6-phosphofructokinase 1
MAVDLLVDGLVNRMVVLRTGIYTNVPITVVQGGSKRVDVDALYDVEEYRPKVRHMNGKPMFLY